MAQPSAQESELDRRIGDLLGRIAAETATEPHHPADPSREEIDASWKDMQLGLVGKVAELFPRFMYFRYEDWLKVASTPPYKQMHDALRQAYAGLVPKIAAQIREKGLKDVYSMGPTPSVDKLLLEQLVREGVTITYHPVDASQEALNSALEEITQHLTARFGNSWEKFVTFDSSEPVKFAEVKSAAPSCVIYDGGTVMNNRKFWEQAAGLAKEGGVVVASAAVTPDEGDWSNYWLSIYDTQEGRRMFENALKGAFPDLFSRKNMGRWDIKFEYVPESWNWPERWGLYQTPMISVQLSVKKPLSVDVTDPETGERVKIYAHPDEKRAYPIVLATSAKLNLAAFLQTVPENFGLRPIEPLDKERYVIREIDYALDGKRGLAAAAIFDVTQPPVGAVPSWDLQPKLPKR